MFYKNVAFFVAVYCPMCKEACIWNSWSCQFCRSSRSRCDKKTLHGCTLCHSWHSCNIHKVSLISISCWFHVHVGWFHAQFITQQWLCLTERVWYMLHIWCFTELGECLLTLIAHFCDIPPVIIFKNIQFCVSVMDLNMKDISILSSLFPKCHVAFEP